MGQGLCLSLCRRIVEGYDREMQVESEVGRGNKFPAIIPSRGSDHIRSRDGAVEA